MESNDPIAAVALQVDPNDVGDHGGVVNPQPISVIRNRHSDVIRDNPKNKPPDFSKVSLEEKELLEILTTLPVVSNENSFRLSMIKLKNEGA